MTGTRRQWTFNCLGKYPRQLFLIWFNFFRIFWVIYYSASDLATHTLTQSLSVYSTASGNQILSCHLLMAAVFDKKNVFHRRLRVRNLQTIDPDSVTERCVLYWMETTGQYQRRSHKPVPEIPPPLFIINLQNYKKKHLSGWLAGMGRVSLCEV